MDEIIKITNLNKSFNDIKAVNNLSFKVKKGEFFAFLGINGAGKSTTISIMCGEQKRDSGEVIVDYKNIDTDLNQIKKNLGVVFQNNTLDKALSVYDNLKFRSSLYGICKEEFEEKYKYFSEKLNFAYLKNRTYQKLSGGEKRRVDIARALIHDPELLILDEPTTGLDPQTRKLVWNFINEIRKERNLTVFLTTHYMEEVNDADYIIILNKGMIVAEGSPLDLKNKYTGDFINIYNPNINLIEKYNLNYTVIPDGIRIEVANTSEATKLILKYPELFNDYEIVKGKMDDVFLNATGIKLGGE